LISSSSVLRKNQEEEHTTGKIDSTAEMIPLFDKKETNSSKNMPYAKQKHLRRCQFHEGIMDKRCLV